MGTIKIDIHVHSTPVLHSCVYRCSVLEKMLSRLLKFLHFYVHVCDGSSKGPRVHPEPSHHTIQTKLLFTVHFLISLPWSHDRCTECSNKTTRPRTNCIWDKGRNSFCRHWQHNPDIHWHTNLDSDQERVVQVLFHTYTKCNQCPAYLLCRHLLCWDTIQLVRNILHRQTYTPKYSCRRLNNFL